MDLQPVGIKSVTVSDDRKEVSLLLEEMIPGYVYDLAVDSLASGKGVPLINRRIYYTLNNIL